MKKLFLFATVLFPFLVSKSQSITGNWDGALHVNGAELKIIFHISKDSSNKLTGTFDSPQQMAYGLKCSSVSVKTDSILIEMKSFGAKYSGLLSVDKKVINGNWSQGGMSLPLDMTKTNE